MKAYDEMAREVFRVGDERIAGKKAKRKKTAAAAASVSALAAVIAVCAVLSGGIPAKTAPTAAARTQKVTEARAGVSAAAKTPADSAPAAENTVSAVREKTNPEKTESPAGNPSAPAKREPEKTDEKSKETGDASGGVYGGDGASGYGWLCMPLLPENRQVLRTGEQITDAEAAAYFAENRGWLQSALLESGVEAGSLRISEKGYSHICYEMGSTRPELRLNYRDYLAYSGDRLVSIITVYKENGTLYSSPAFGGPWFADYAETLRAHRGEKLLFLYAGATELILTADGEILNPMGLNLSADFPGDRAEIYEAFYSPEAVYIP